MNVFKRYNNFNKAPAVRHGGGGVRTSDAAASERFQQREAIASRARASKAFVWKSGWNQKMGPTTTAATLNERNAIFWKKQNGN